MESYKEINQIGIKKEEDRRKIEKESCQLIQMILTVGTLDENHQSITYLMKTRLNKNKNKFSDKVNKYTKLSK